MALGGMEMPIPQLSPEGPTDEPTDARRGVLSADSIAVSIMQVGAMLTEGESDACTESFPTFSRLVGQAAEGASVRSPRGVYNCAGNDGSLSFKILDAAAAEKENRGSAAAPISKSPRAMNASRAFFASFLCRRALGFLLGSRTRGGGQRSGSLNPSYTVGHCESGDSALGKLHSAVQNWTVGSRRKTGTRSGSLKPSGSAELCESSGTVLGMSH
mmetsp:Transcript_1422/g.3147  ORF Transcript_1422/g.3147 Transcript_1422/m.3147 type:complete len:215 (+) Transcript_1422:224-868(+)